MRLRTYYIGAILIPLAVFAAVAAAGGDDGSSTLGLGPGATVHWLYPRAAIRELIAYAAVAAWLLWTLHRRPMAEFQQAVWRAPLLLVVIHFLFPVAVLLATAWCARWPRSRAGASSFGSWSDSSWASAMWRSPNGCGDNFPGGSRRASAS